MVNLRSSLAALVIATLGAIMPAQASAPILIWPINPAIEADHGAGALWLENRGSAPAVMQVRVFRWAQANGEDQYEEQLEVEASPPMARIQPGARQLIRLTSNQAARPPGESAYRIVVDEVPVRQEAPASPSSDGGTAPHAAGVRLQMRYSIPLFVYTPLPDGAKLDRKGAPRLRCSLSSDKGSTVVQITNSGNTHARLVDVSFDVNGQPAFLAKGLLGYVLSGSTISLPLPEGVTGHEPMSMAGPGGARISVPGCAD